MLRQMVHQRLDEFDHQNTIKIESCTNEEKKTESVSRGHKQKKKKK